MGSARVNPELHCNVHDSSTGVLAHVVALVSKLSRSGLAAQGAHATPKVGLVPVGFPKLEKSVTWHTAHEPRVCPPAAKKLPAFQKTWDMSVTADVSQLLRSADAKASVPANMNRKFLARDVSHLFKSESVKLVAALNIALNPDCVARDVSHSFKSELKVIALLNIP